MTNPERDQKSRPRVFVSSVIEGLEEVRVAARRAVGHVGGHAVLVNEDFPATATSSRNACLDAVDSCDVYLIIVGKRGGWTAPSGKLVVEEEYDRAKQRGLPILVFLMRTERDTDAERLSNELSHYVKGTYRRTFDNMQELQTEIEQALAPVLAMLQRPIVNDKELLTVFEAPYQVRDQTTLRFALIPERSEEVIDPVQLGSPDFLDSIYRLAHAPEVRLFSYEQPKRTELKGESLVILQCSAERVHSGFIETRLCLAGSGQLVIDANVTGRRPKQDTFDMADSFVVALEDVEATLRPVFSFAAAFFDEVDKFERHQRFYYDVALSGIGYRKLVQSPKPQKSHSMRMSGSDEPVIVFDAPRLVTRATLQSPKDEIQRVITLLPRRVGD